MKANRIAELVELAQSWHCTYTEALVDSIYNFYEAAGFERDHLDAEFGSMSAEELERVYLNL